MSDSFSHWRPTLGQVFALSLACLAGVLMLLFYFVMSGTGETIVGSSNRLRDQASREIGEHVVRILAEAPATVEQFQREISHGVLDPRDPAQLEQALFALLLSNKNLGELTLTFGEHTGYNADGWIELAPAPRGQLSVARFPAGVTEEVVWSRKIRQENAGFIAERRVLEKEKAWNAVPLTRDATAAWADPTTHPTFVTPARKDFEGRLLWSDLHWSQLDDELPPAERRVEVSVQQVVRDAQGKFLGVLRVGLLTETLDRVVKVHLAGESEADPHRIFLCDTDGRLITRLAPSDALVEVEDDLRIAPGMLPPEVREALARTNLHAASESTRSVSGEFRHAGEDYLTTFRPLPAAQTQDWIVGIVVPRAYYLGKLVAVRNRLLTISLAIMLGLVAGGGLILRGVKRAQAQIVRESLKMNAFDFAPVPVVSFFHDVRGVLESLEKAKTAMRAMGKYIPVDLVRRLYRDQQEPTLGGELTEVSIMFTDIRDFTTLSERLAPDELAGALALYLEAMSRIIQHDTHGTIDKYIGDAIMTFWNAPEPVAEHARMACLAALRCREAGRALGQSPPEWRGWPRLSRRGSACTGPRR